MRKITYSLLDYLAIQQSAAALRLLRQHGADLWREDGEGHTPLQVAKATSERQPSQAAQMLQQLADNVAAT